MAFEDNQQEPALPGGNKNYKRKVHNHLPKYFRTEFNNKFLTATLDRLMQPGVAEKITGFYGRKTVKQFSATDNYIGDIDKDRENYQLEPASIIKDDLGNVEYYADYNDYINTLKNYGNQNINHSDTNLQEYYAWDPHVDWDKLINFREYYWMPSGPPTLSVAGQSKTIESTYTVSLGNNADNSTYVFTPDGLTNNPTITLYRGQTYKFSIDTPAHPIAFATDKSFIPGSITLEETSSGIRSAGNFDVNLYSIDENTKLLYTVGVKNIVYEQSFREFLDEDGIDNTVFVEKGIIEFTVPENAPDYLYYISQNDPNLSGLMRINDIIENTEIDVEKEIIGKKTYKTTDDWFLSNGMKIKFVGKVLTEKYAKGEWYVEGVGDSIRLIEQNDLLIRGLFTDDVKTKFGQQFDQLPFGEALGYPVTKDYIVINRASKDGNLWSRYNRWFHKDVIEKSFQITNQNFVLDQDARAKRPILEFEAGLKLYNFGTQRKNNIDLLDTFTTDAFSIVEGSSGYNIDGIDLVDGMRVIFLKDLDPLVYGKIFQVKFVTINGVLQITLQEDTDSESLNNETVLVSNGTQHSGKAYYYTGVEWRLCQQKTAVNQSPIFDMYDGADIQYNDTLLYANSQFAGNKIFSYATSSGVLDPELGISLQYRNIENTGDILFNFDLVSNSFVYNKDNQVTSVSTNSGFLRIYNSRTDYSLVNGWTKPDYNSRQNIIRQYIAQDEQEKFAIDVYNETDFLASAWLRVYKNNVKQKLNLDYVIYADANDKKYIQFLSKCKKNDIILFKIRSKYTKNDNGMYEIADNFEKNPLNDKLSDFTLGEISDHLSTIAEEINDFDGQYPGNSNIRDLGKISKYGRKFLIHSCPINLPLYHLINQQSNVLDAIDFSMTEYTKFKRNFISTADSSGYDGRTKPHVDSVLQTMNADKVINMPFYLSDMLPIVGNTVSETTIIDIDEKYFPLSKPFSSTTPSRSAVSVYRNNSLAVYGIDYVFDPDGFVVYDGYKQVGDVIEVVEYESTNGSYIPATPTKLGLYPKFTPELYIDTSYGSNGDNNDAGAYQIYGQPVGKQYNSESIGYAYPVYATYNEATTADLDLGGAGEAVLYKFNGLNRPFYMPKSDQNVAKSESVNYEIWDEGIAVIQGHDGSIVKAFGDYKDKLILELEKRIYNNCKQEYSTDLFNVHDFVSGLHRKIGIAKNKIDSCMFSSFINWTQLVDGLYTENTYYDAQNSKTYNYNLTRFSNNEALPGWWRQIFTYVYDTDRPNTHPWEMLGFSQKPIWWDAQYGSAPYTSNNLILWEDLSKGIIRQPNFSVNSKYVRNNLLNQIPVDEDGNLLSPSQANLPASVPFDGLSQSFAFGDGGPIETAWRKSSEYPFALMRSMVINRPCKVFATAWDRIRQKRNIIGQIVYGADANFLQLQNLIFPNSVNDAVDTITSGLVNFVIDYQNKEYNINISKYKENLSAIKNQLGMKIGGFTDKSKFKLILDSRTPLNQGNVFVPQNNYDIFLCKSATITEISYSGVIVEKQPNGFFIRGYDTKNPRFTFYNAIPKKNDVSINIGGVSEAFVTWDNRKAYAVGTIVKNTIDNLYYRCTSTHTSGEEFDYTKFVSLPNLPTVGGRDLLFRKNFNDYTSTLEYGSFFADPQDVADFLQGYGKYLEEQGFSFSRFLGDEYEIADWNLAATQFIFWTTQRWNAGSVISLSPGAHKINFSSSKYTVGNVFDVVGGFSVKRANNKVINPQNLKFFKDDSNNFSVKTVNTRSGIYFVKLPLVTYEHAVIIDNKTDFNDIIYDLVPGYRQARIKVIGYRTDDWNGSVNLSGFLYDDARLTNWEQFKDYDIGSLVKQKEFYYIARRKISGAEFFDEKEWFRLDEKPEKTLLPNFDYKVKQFADFYNLDSDNFDTEQQKLAQHLIGYQKRQYLENIINDDVSQYKFYQGYIREKGTKNSLSKLFDVLSSADKDSLEFFEEWAVKDGQYGANATFSEVEYVLDESKFRLTPQPILLTDYITGKETDLIYRIPKYETYLTPSNYNHKPFPTKYLDKTYVKNAGYVHPDDVQFVIDNYSQLIDIDYNSINQNDYVWVGNHKNTWNVYQYVNSGILIDEISIKTDINDKIYVHATTNVNNIEKGQIIGVNDITKFIVDIQDNTKGIFANSIVNGFFEVSSVTNNIIELNASTSFVPQVAGESFGKGNGYISVFDSARVPDISSANRLAEKNIAENFKIWLDNDTNNRWAVLQNQNTFYEHDVVSNPESGNTNFLSSIAFDKRNNWMVIGAPNDGEGKVYIYNRPSTNAKWMLQEILQPDLTAATNQTFGFSVAISPDAKFLLVGAPTASNIKTFFVGDYATTSTYNQNDIVKYNDNFWQALSKIIQDQSNITFSSVQNYNNILYNLNLDESAAEIVPLVLAGDYPLVNTDTSHFLLRAPKLVYDAVDVEDQVVLNWNKLTNANQTQIELTPRQPFSGDIGGFSETTIDGMHTIQEKIDVVMYVISYVNLPQINDVITSGNTAGKVVYVKPQGSNCTIYINKVSGNFATEEVKDSYINATNFIGAYTIVAPVEVTDTSSELGGYFMINVPTYTVGTSNTDSGRGLVITDIITDSTVSTRYYYNILDNKTQTIQSENTDHSLLRKLSGQEGIGPFGSTDIPVSAYWMIRGPKLLTDQLANNDQFYLYFNNLKRTVTTFTARNIRQNQEPTLVKGEVLTQENTGASAIVFNSTVVTDPLSDVTARVYTIEVEGVNGTFNFTDKLIGSISGDVDLRPLSNPVTDILVQPSDIGIPNTTATALQTVFDIWDGYIEYELTQFFENQPFEPIAKYKYVTGTDLVDSGQAGQLVRDKNTGATAEVMYYERSGSVCKIFVKNVSGTWSLGEVFGDRQDIEMLTYSPGPAIDDFGRSQIYDVDRTIGAIEKVSLGYDLSGIGKLIIFKADQSLPVTFDSVTGKLTKEIKDLEYWLYTQATVSGIQQSAEIPSNDSIAWKPIHKISPNINATTKNYTNLGLCYIYENVNQNFTLNSIVLPSDIKNNHYFGSKVKVTSSNELGRAFILAADGESVSNAGRIYFLKRGSENNNIYNWDYARNKKFKGEFSNTQNYLTDDVVYLHNDGAGQLYTAKTNIIAGPFNVQLWNLNDSLIDYVGYIPNTTGLTVRDDSFVDSALSMLNLFDFGTDYDVSDDGEVLAVIAKYTGQANSVAIYRNINGFYQLSQTISASDPKIEFTKSIAVNNDGTQLIIGCPKDKSIKLDQGLVYVYKQVSGTFVLDQTLYSPENKTAIMFGWKVSCDKNKIVVNAKNGDVNITTTFDKKKTVFDHKFTYFAYENDDQGALYVYEDINGKYVFGNALGYNIENEPVYYFGRQHTIIDNHVYVSLPRVKKDSTANVGTLVDFKIDSNIYNIIRKANDTVNLDKIKRVILYNKVDKKLIQYLDYIDPLQGKIAGPAEENLTFKLYYDPATYSYSTDSKITANETDKWTTYHVGKLWWDLTNSKFYYPYQGDVTFAVNFWSKSFLSNNVDIFEWIESDIPPSSWDAIADTTEGISRGISGKSKYGDSVYSTNRIYDQISQTFTTKYYFWVKNKKTIPVDVVGRSLSADSVATMIYDPANTGYQFVSLVNNDSFAIYNCESIIKDKDIVLGFQYYNNEVSTANVHNQYQIITEGLGTSRPNKNIENKWIDSLVGFDNFGRNVPDITLTEKEKYGNLNKPRQSWFANREEALKQYIERVNSVLIQNLVVDNKNLSKIQESDLYPSALTRLYDVAVDTVADLNLYGTSSFIQAAVNITVSNGKIIEVVITNPGKGYLVVPTFDIIGNGVDADIEFTIDVNGSLSSVNIVNQGKNYPTNTQIVLRPLSILVLADETLNGKWAIYERNVTAKKWDRIRSQGFNVNLYWEYADWYATGYTTFSNIDYTVDLSYQLDNLPAAIGDVVKIKTVGTGGWSLLEKIADIPDADYTRNYSTIGRQNGTIQFKPALYNSSISYNNFDLVSFDTQLYDGIPSTEIRKIIEFIKDELLVNELEIEYNKLFFSSLRYAFAEQKYIDWAFKTSFIRAKHNVGEFAQDITFNNANLPSYQDYVQEVKPFKSKIREYISSYEKLNNTQSFVSDFDLAPRYDNISDSIQPYTAKVIDDVLVGSNNISTYPAKAWVDTIGHSIKAIEISDGGKGYVTPPKIIFTSQSGKGAIAETSIANDGSIINVVIKNSGNGYLTAPLITIDGALNEQGIPAKLSVILDKPLSRSMNTAIKFDRVSGNFVFTDLNETETFICSGSKYVFDLVWPLDYNKTNLTVTLDNIELLTSEYTYENILDKTKTYNRYHGRITCTIPPAANTSLKVAYKKDIKLLDAQDRINLAYFPVSGQFGKDLSQVMDGIDYGGVEVKSFDFGQQSGWDEIPWFDGSYDTYDITYKDQVIKLDGSTTTLQLDNILENNVVYNIYKNGIRLDDPNWTGDSTGSDNPNAIMRSITGDGVTNTLQLQELGISVVADDIIIVRPTTSDGSFLPTNINFDTVLSGGNLNYSNAKGIAAEEIVVDGEGFITPVNCKGPEEVVPGQVQDTLDIQVYERPTGGTSEIITHNYTGDGSTKIFEFGNNLNDRNALFVKIDKILQNNSVYTFDFTNNTIEFVNAPAAGSAINLTALGYSGNNILDIDTAVADGNTSKFLTNVSYKTGVTALVTIDGEAVDHTLIQSDDSSFPVKDNFVISLDSVPASNKVLKFALFDGTQKEYSIVTVDNFTFTNSESFSLTQTPFSIEPSEWEVLVKVNNNILNAGYVETFNVSTTRGYRLKLHQVPMQSVSNKQIRVFLNNKEIIYMQQWSFAGSAEYDPLVSDDMQSGSTITLFDGVGDTGDKLDVFINGWDDSTQSGGDYRFGYFDADGNFVKTPGILYINTPLVANDTVTVYQFSDSTHQGIDRQSFDVTERTELDAGTFGNRYTEVMDGSTSIINLPFELVGGFKYALFKNDIRLDDPNFGTPYSLNPNAVMVSIDGNGSSQISLHDFSITVVENDFITIELIGNEFTHNPGTADWYEFRQIRNGVLPLQYPVIDDQYVWVVKNGVLLDSSIDYYVMPNKQKVKVIKPFVENDTVEIIHFSNKKLQSKFGWRQFKDVLNRNHYKALQTAGNCALASNLNWYDRKIEVTDSSALPDPQENTKYPGVVFINGERIEYFIKDGNFLKQLRRGTLGTGTKSIHAIGTEVFDQSIDTSMPYTDETKTTIFTGDGSTKQFTLDFVPIGGVNGFEVFVAGKRLRKNEIASYQLNTTTRQQYALENNSIAQDSPEGDIILPAEFSVTSDGVLTLLNTPKTGQKIIILRKQGKRWTDQGVSLSNSNNDIVNFLQTKQVDLPR